MHKKEANGLCMTIQQSLFVLLIAKRMLKPLLTIGINFMFNIKDYRKKRVKDELGNCKGCSFYRTINCCITYPKDYHCVVIGKNTKSYAYIFVKK